MLLLIQVISVVIYLHASLSCASNNFENLLQVDTFEETAFKSHASWTKAMGELVLMVNSLKMLHALFNIPESFDERAYYGHFLSGLILETIHCKNLLSSEDTENLKVEQILFKKWDRLEDFAITLTKSENGATTEGIQFRLNVFVPPDKVCYLPNANSIVPGMPVSNVTITYICMDLKQQTNAGIHDRLVKIYEAFCVFADEFKQNMLNLFAQTLMNSGKVNPVVLAYIDVSFRVHSWKEALKFEAKSLQEAIFRSTYKKLWKSFVPKSHLIFPSQLIAGNHEPHKKFITHVNYNGYQRVEPSTSVLVFRDGSEFCASSQSGALSFHVLGAFAKEPLTWSEKKLWSVENDFPTIAHMNALPFLWNSAILQIHDTLTVPKASVRNTLLQLHEYNQIISDWNTLFIRLSKKLWKMQDLPKTGLLTTQKSRFSNSTFYDLKWLMDSRDEGKGDLLRCTYSRPIAMYSLLPPYSLKFFPATPHSMIVLKAKEALTKFYD